MSLHFLSQCKTMLNSRRNASKKGAVFLKINSFNNIPWFRTGYMSPACLVKKRAGGKSTNVYYKIVTEENMGWLWLGHQYKPFGAVLPTTP